MPHDRADDRQHHLCQPEAEHEFAHALQLGQVELQPDDEHEEDDAESRHGKVEDLARTNPQPGTFVVAEQIHGEPQAGVKGQEQAGDNATARRPDTDRRHQNRDQQKVLGAFVQRNGMPGALDILVDEPPRQRGLGPDDAAR